MANIKPFAAYRPAEGLAGKIAALPYDVFTTDEARRAAGSNPYSFLRVDKAEIELDESVSPYDPQVYERAADNLNRLIAEGAFKKDAKEALYIYRLETEGRRQTGIAALTSIDDYAAGTLVKHELTRKDKEDDRARHIEYLKAHTGPIFLAYKTSPENAGIKRLIESLTASRKPAAVFDDGVLNSVWVIDDDTSVNELTGMFSGVERLFIADGHHRCAAAARVGFSAREREKDYTGEEWYNYCLSVVFPEDELCIMPYNRVVADLNGHTAESFMEAVSAKFSVLPCPGRFVPAKKGEFGVRLAGKWYALTLRDAIGATGALDVSVLHEHIIEPLLGITDVRGDKRIDFIGGSDSVLEIERLTAAGESAVGFSLFPTSMEELISVAGAGGIMPPKSTWFEPKLRSGLFVHRALP